MTQKAYPKPLLTGEIEIYQARKVPLSGRFRGAKTEI
jgi:hypothetical protein